MCAEEIKDCDEVSRSVFWPKDYVDKGLGPLDLSFGFNFQEKDDDSESVNCHRLLDYKPEKIHSLGVKKQDNDNANFPDRNPLRQYKGYKAANVGQIRAEAKVEDASFDVLHAPENDNVAHCNIKMLYENKKPKKSKRALLIDRLNRCFEELEPYESD